MVDNLALLIGHALLFLTLIAALKADAPPKPKPPPRRFQR